MGNFIQQLINGLTVGAFYGLIAIGYTMVYGIIGMINFAHGEIYMLGATIAVIAFTLLLGVPGLPIAVMIPLVLMVSMILTGLYGWTIERLAYRPLRSSFRLAPLISAIGVSIFLQSYAVITQSARTKTMSPLITERWVLFTGDDGFAVTLSLMQIVVVAVTTVLMLGFAWLIKGTALGRSQRAVEQDRVMSALLGVPVDRTISITFIIGAALAAVAGVLAVVYYGVVDFYMGFLAGMKAFTAAVLGGIGSLPGAMLGGLLIGLIETLWTAYFNGAFKDVAAFSVLVLVLIFRPSGLLGRPEIEKV